MRPAAATRRTDGDLAPDRHAVQRALDAGARRFAFDVTGVSFTHGRDAALLQVLIGSVRCRGGKAVVFGVDDAATRAALSDGLLSAVPRVDDEVAARVLLAQR